MPSIISHSIVGIATGHALSHKNRPKRFWLLSAVCPVLPDADVIGFAFGIPYHHFLGHRGFFHSLFFALLLGVFVVSIFFRNEKAFSKHWLLLTVYFSFITATHGILDAFTSGGLGIALLSPFNDTRYFSPWTPILVSPIGIRAFFSEWGLQTILSEMFWIWLPSVLLAVLVKLIQSRNAGTREAWRTRDG